MKHTVWLTVVEVMTLINQLLSQLLSMSKRCINFASSIRSEACLFVGMSIDSNNPIENNLHTNNCAF